MFYSKSKGFSYTFKGLIHLRLISVRMWARRLTPSFPYWITKSFRLFTEKIHGSQYSNANLVVSYVSVGAWIWRWPSHSLLVVLLLCPHIMTLPRLLSRTFSFWGIHPCCGPSTSAGRDLSLHVQEFIRPFAWFVVCGCYRALPFVHAFRWPYSFLSGVL